MACRSPVGRNDVRCWLVNQNQTLRQEIEGGYPWSTKRNKNGHRNRLYEFMREVAPGDVAFSFCDTRIAVLPSRSVPSSLLIRPRTMMLAGIVQQILDNLHPCHSWLTL